MKSVVITGSTKGIGLGMAHEFLKRGHRVMISGSNQETLNQALQKLTAQFGKEKVQGQTCDVRSYEQVQAIWDASIKAFGKVDIWINNAGVGASRIPFWEISFDRIEQVVHTNALGMMYGSKIALQGMIKQGSGQIYNMEGEGSTGGVREGLILYGSTKATLTYLTKGLIKEAANTPVQVCYLSPGMVITDLLMGDTKPEDMERVKRIFNILADTVETVTPWLVEQVLANNKHGIRIAWLTKRKAMWRFASARFNKRDLFA